MKPASKNKKKSPRANEGELSGKTGMLRVLHKVQLSVPDRYFFVSRYRSEKADKGGGKKEKNGLFPIRSFLGGRKRPKLDIVVVREQVRTFHNSFLARKKSEGGTNSSNSEVMSIAYMNEFRNKVRKAAESPGANLEYHAMDAVVKFIDLRNSGITVDKQNILQNCLWKIGRALNQDGGLSIFHTTWFLSAYREYLNGYKMFKRGEYENALKNGDAETQTIVKKLNRKQFEIPLYLAMIGEKHLDVKKITMYSKEGSVKNSKHWQKGCTRQDIKKIFYDECREEVADASKAGRITEVNVIMAYALLFARIPMMYEVVESIKTAIPNLKTDTNLYKQKITIAQKINLLELARGVYQHEDSKDQDKKLFHMARIVFDYCSNVIAENRLQKIPLKSNIFTFPFLKQATILINYKNIFRGDQEEYFKMIDKSIEHLQTVKACASDGQRSVAKMAAHAETYEKNLLNIKSQVASEKSAGYGQGDYGEAHQNF